MPKDTDIIDSLFLELSQFTQAKTAKELALEAKCAEMRHAIQVLVSGLHHKALNDPAIQKMVDHALSSS